MIKRDKLGRLMKGSKMMLGHKTSDETKHKLSLAMKYRQGDKNPAWKGGRIKSSGCICLWMPEHPYADVKGYVKEHRYIMEQHIGRYLSSTEAIHHKDHNRYNNSIENLEIIGWREHALLHQNWKFIKTHDKL
jgi:hypothetical protein